MASRTRRAIFFCLALFLMLGIGLMWWVKGSAPASPPPDISAETVQEAETYLRRPLPRIPPDTTFAAKPPDGWSHIVHFVIGRIGKGDLEEVTSVMNEAAEDFNLVLMANVTRSQENPFQLANVGVGFSTPQDGENIIVTSDESNRKSHVKLSFISEQLLEIHEASLKDFVQIARNDAACLFESSLLMLRDGEHRRMVLRYLIHCSAANGELQTWAWLTEKTMRDEKAAYSLAEPHFQLLPESFRENRVMNIMGSRVFLGIPQPTALAVVDMPRGTPIAPSSALEKLACLANYDSRNFQELIDGLMKTTAAQTQER